MNKKYYVSMTDKFLSGWGHAKNKINKYLITCDTYEQAETIEKNAHKRNEMKYINIHSTKPYYNKYRYLVSEEHFNNLGHIWTK